MPHRRDPVFLIASGVTYDRSSLEALMQDGKGACPTTGERAVGHTRGLVGQGRGKLEHEILTQDGKGIASPPVITLGCWVQEAQR